MGNDESGSWNREDPITWEEYFWWLAIILAFEIVILAPAIIAILDKFFPR